MLCHWLEQPLERRQGDGGDELRAGAGLLFKWPCFPWRTHCYLFDMPWALDPLESGLPSQAWVGHCHCSVRNLCLSADSHYYHGHAKSILSSWLLRAWVCRPGMGLSKISQTRSYKGSQVVKWLPSEKCEEGQLLLSVSNISNVRNLPLTCILLPGVLHLSVPI